MNLGRGKNKWMLFMHVVLCFQGSFGNTPNKEKNNNDRNKTFYVEFDWLIEGNMQRPLPRPLRLSDWETGKIDDVPEPVGCPGLPAGL